MFVSFFGKQGFRITKFRVTGMSLGGWLLRMVVIPAWLGSSVTGVAGSLAEVGAVKTETPPVMDGRLDDAVWKRGGVVSGLRQYKPRAGKPMSERTEIRVLYDADFLYLGVRCYDREPGKIASRGMERDGGVLASDYVYFFFDTFYDRRNGYAFAVSPDEGRWDALISNAFHVNTNWDGIWDVRCSIDRQGWVAEVKIPFKTLGFREGETVWGFNVARSIARKGEAGRWVDPRPEVETQYAGNAGRLTGLTGMEQGVGVTFSPYLLGRSRYSKFGSDESEVDAGFDFRYRLTPSLTATLSYNTDFAETEVDQRQINFSRFPLFFPEKRAFFLEDSGIYRFSSEKDNLLIPYYSRRIGLNNRGERVPLIGAAKLSGRVGDYELGMTAAHLDSHGGLGNQSVFAGRVVRHLGQHSSLGAMVTVGDPNSEGDNYLGGLDYRFQTSTFRGDKTLMANVFALGTVTQPDGAGEFSGHAFGLGLNYPNDTFNFRLNAMEISDGFNPALGFVRRTGIRQYSSSWRYLKRCDDPTYLQWVSLVYANEIITDLDNELKTRSHSIYPLVLKLGSGDELSYGLTQTLDEIDAAFPIPGGSTIAMGRYDMLTHDVKCQLSDTRAVSGELGMQWGDFYGGDWKRAYANLWWSPHKRLAVGVNYEWNTFDMPDADIDSQLVSAWLVWRFSPRMRWSNLIQYDTLSDTMGVNSRFSWEFKPGKNVNIVLSQLYWDQRGSFQLLDSELVAKAQLQFRF